MRFLLLLLFPSFLAAQLRLPAILSSGMVLQQKKANRIWGWAEPDQLVSVRFQGKNYAAYANLRGEWQLFLDPSEAGKAGNMLVSAGNKNLKVENILIGEVWICSGQSNMVWTMEMLPGIYTEEKHSAQNDDIRFVTVANKYANRPQEDLVLANPWLPIDSNSILKCSAVGYWYAKKLQQQLKVPVGLVISAWGGTPAQAWLSFEALHDFQHYTLPFEEHIHALNTDHIGDQSKAIDARFRKQIQDKSALVRAAIRPDFDDSKWSEMRLPGEWEEQGFPTLDGIVMYRMNFKVDKSDAGKEAIIHLPAVDDMDSTFINGVFIGSVNQWDALRTYTIPAGVLKAGKNSLVIYVEDGRGGGGLSPAEDKFNIQIKRKIIPLKCMAKYSIIAVLEDMTGGNGALEHQAGVLYNAMIAPLLPLSIRGAIWYQGESNTDWPTEYRTLFPSLIRDWRNRWGQGDFPFLFAQISSFGLVKDEPGPSDWAMLREAQGRALKLPNTAMAVTTDIGNPQDIHPKQKQEVGERLADQALAMCYGASNTVCSGPRYKSSRIEGDKIILEFDHIGSGLTQKGAGLKSFSIAGEDKKFYWAEARISGNQVVVSSTKVSAPKAVRYAWAASPIEANLYNKEGYPAEPFRTDYVPETNPVIAHRGAWKKNGLPENSIAALRNAIELGCAGSEFDVRMTADDSLVINHDPNYNGLPIEKTTYAALQQFKLSNGEKLPTLREYILAGMRGNDATKLICEIKPSDISKERGKEIATKVLRVFRELQARHQVLYISFDYDILKRIVELDPLANTQYLDGGFSPDQLHADGINGADFHFSVYQNHPDWVNMAKRNFMQLNAWTVNEAKDMENLLNLKFNAITTNEPELLMELFLRRGE